jgi:hypothetical protein
MGRREQTVVRDRVTGADDPWVEQNLRVPTHALAATGYGLIAALGATRGFDVVFVCLLLLSVSALMVAVLHDLGWVALVGAVPVLGWALALYLIATRSELLDEHVHAVTIALGVSAAPYLVAGLLHGSPQVAFVVGAALWHVVGVHAYRLGFDATSFSRTAALGPALVLLLVLPLLDLDLPALDLGLDSPGDAHPA